MDPKTFQSEPDDRMQRLFRGSTLWIGSLLFALLLTAIFAIDFLSPSTIEIELGEAYPENLYAPGALTFVSHAETDQLRQQARDSIPDEYTALDLNIGRQQRSKAQAIFNFIDVVKADLMASEEQKIESILLVEEISISEEIASAIVSLNTTQFDAVKLESLNTVEDTMQSEIKENNVAEARNSAKNQIAFSFNEVQEEIFRGIIPQLIVPNAFYDEVATQRKRDEAAAAVTLVTREIREGQLLIREGETVGAADLELLEALGLRQTETDWARVASVGLASLLGVIIFVLYWQRYAQKAMSTTRQLIYFCLLILLFAVAGRFMLPSRTGLSYLFPMAAMSILLAAIFDVRLAIMATIVLATLVGFIASNSLELAVYASVGGILAALSLRESYRINAYFRAGTVAAIANVAVIAMFHLTQDADPIELIQLAGLALINGLLSAGATLGGLYLIDNTFGVTATVLKLQELSRLDHPLLQELLRRAPGTYHHSIMVANLAEQAAEQVEANATLVRVGAFYHDVGKMNRPPFFTENQAGVNPHDNLDPFSSARIIIGHVADGVTLARQHKLPQKIIDFIAEHHGSSQVSVFYHKAVAAADGDEERVDVDRFTYPGPRPQSRETGIVMLADTVDATSNALRPDTESAIEKLVNKLIDKHMKDGQLDDSGLTLGDIQLIRASFINTLKGRYHVRVRYPGNEELEIDSSETAEAASNRQSLPLSGQSAPASAK